MRGSERRLRVAEAIRKEVAGILRFQFRDPRVARATVTRAEVTGDMSLARVHVSVLGSESEQQETLEVLGRARGRVRTLLGRRVRLRQTPEVRFVFDPSVEFSVRLEEILERERERSPEEDGEDPADDDGSRSGEAPERPGEGS